MTPEHSRLVDNFWPIWFQSTLLGAMANLSDRKVHSPPERAVKIILGILDRALEKTCRNKEEVAPRGQNDLSIFPNEHNRHCFNSQGINAKRRSEKMLARKGSGNARSLIVISRAHQPRDVQAMVHRKLSSLSQLPVSYFTEGTLRGSSPPGTVPYAEPGA